jgi:two-component sensor histidine kinase
MTGARQSAMTDDDAVRIAALESDNRRLRRLLDNVGAPDELRHRLNSTLAMLRVIIKKTAETPRELDDYVAHLDDRLEAISRALAAADSRGWIDLHILLADELLFYKIAEGEQLTLSGPCVQFEPRAGQVLSLAMHELAVNAIEHGHLGSGAGSLEIEWSVADHGDPSPIFQLAWREGGQNDGPLPTRTGFGMEVLTRTVRYELRATHELSRGAGNLFYTIRFPLTDGIGRLVTP